jgi:uncharacterized protein (DUF305 family)
MNSSLRSILAAVVACAIVACADAASPVPPTTVAQRIDATASGGRSSEVFEVKLIQEMIDDHAAVMMWGQLCLSRATHGELRQWCGDVVATHGTEVEPLRAWLTEWYALSHDPTIPPGSKNALERLASRGGETFDRDLMGILLDHFERAIKDVRHCGDKAVHVQLATLCEDVAVERNVEIEQLRLWLCAWYGLCKRGVESPGEVAVVLSSFEPSLTFFPVDRSIGVRELRLTESFPAGFSRRGSTLAVPAGSVLTLVDLTSRTVSGLVRLPEGASAGGSAFLDDSLVIVTNSALNSISVVNVRRQALVREVAAADFDWPRAVSVQGGLVFVANAMFGGDYWMDRPGTVTVLDAATLAVVRTVQLSGWNALVITRGPDGRVWVLNSGETPGRGTRGSLSVLDPSTLGEVEHHVGFGYLPTGFAWGPDGLAYISSGAYGIAVWNPQTDAFVRSPENAVAPDGIPSASAATFDREGRLYALVARSCDAPGSAYRLDSAYRVDVRVAVGVCPSAIDVFPAP